MIFLNLGDVEWIMAVQKELKFDFTGFIDGGEFFFGGQFKDINREFITLINQPLHILMVIEFFTSIALKLMNNFAQLGKIQIMKSRALL